MALKLVQTQYGALRGITGDGYTTFRGIPFARPPVGALRWRPPVDPEAWEGVREAAAFGNRPVQIRHTLGSFYFKEFYNDEAFMPPMSEDALYLNVWTPARSSGDKLPVALWIHGGAFVCGFGSEMEFDGAGYCGQGVILVTFNYRLGPFGFLACDETTGTTGGAGTTGNYGLLDQLHALKWVRENISAFGGDPDRITVMGQSAGAQSVRILTSSGLTWGQIGAAILQSGGSYRTGMQPMKEAEAARADGRGFMAHSGVSSIEGLRGLSSEEILERSLSFKQAEFRPYLDNVILHRPWDDLIDAGEHHAIPYMTGSTARDTGSEDGAVSPLYDSCIRFSHANQRLGRAPAYVYQFAQAPLGDDAGAFHSSELWYMFGTLGRSWRPKTEADYAVSRRMLEYWCNFIKKGDPNGGALPAWRPCACGDPYVLRI
jgi:para-nitrobenzyl esterase